MSYKLSFTAQELEKLYAKQSLEIVQEVSVSDDSYIVVKVDFAIADGSEIKFKSPADCSQIVGIRVWYKSGDNTTFQNFNFADAHGNNVGDIDHLFAANAVVKVILDVAGSMAFVQNAATNAYIERTFIKSINGVTPDPETGDVALEVSGSNNCMAAGERVAGKTFKTDFLEAVAEEGAEVFNDYEHNIATGAWSHAEGSNSMASSLASHAEGSGATASGLASHAEGFDSTAEGGASHTEGDCTHATGYASHAEGWCTEAFGEASHAEGDCTHATGYASHAEGCGTIAAGENQHVQGKWNKADPDGIYAHIVGGGEEENLRNIHTIDWNGNAWFNGDIYVGGNSQDESTKLTIIPTVTSEDNGKFLRVVDGAWAAASIPNAEEASF